MRESYWKGTASKRSKERSLILTTMLLLGLSPVWAQGPGPELFESNSNLGTNHLLINDGFGTFTDSGQMLGADSSRDAAVGDINGDGSNDVVVASENTGFIFYINDGSGTFTQMDPGLSTAGGNIGVALGDLDGDGDLDIAGARTDGFANPTFFNDGSGNFTAGTTFGAGTSQTVALGDLDGDGDLDAAVGNANGEGDRIFFNNGGGVLMDSGQVLGNTNTFGMSLGDVDRDGDLDLLIPAAFDVPNSLFLNNGGGVFTDSGLFLGNRDSSDGLLGDVNGDRFPDAVFLNWSGQGNTVFLNDGFGGFNDTGQSLGNSHSNLGSLFDIDQDGDLDLAVANDGEPNRIFINDGGGTFSDSGQALGGNAITWTMVPGEFNGPPDMEVFGNMQPINYLSRMPSPANNTDLGSTPVGDSITKTFEISNTGSGNLNIHNILSINGEPPGVFVLQNVPVMVAPGTTGFFEVVFTPGGQNEANCLLSIISDDPQHLVFPFLIRGRGMANGAPELHVFDGPTEILHNSSYAFGVLVPGLFEVAGFTLENRGAADLNITEVLLVGGDADQFTLQFNDLTPLPSQGVRSFSVVFNPSTIGNKQTVLKISTDDPHFPILEINLSGVAEEELPIEDPTLEAILKIRFDANSNDILDLDEILTPTRLDLSNSGVRSLQGLSGFVNLREIIASKNRLVSLQPGNLPLGLEALDVSSNPLDYRRERMAGGRVAFPTSLTELNMDDCRLTSTDVLLGLENLETLNLAHNRLAAFTHGEDLTALRDLDLSQNRLTDFSPIAALTDLGTQPGDRLMLENNLVDNTQCADIGILNNRFSNGGGVLEVGTMGNFSLLNEQLPNWGSPPNTLLDWVDQISTAAFTYSPCD